MALPTPSCVEKYSGLQGYARGLANGAIEVPFLVKGFNNAGETAAYAIANSPQYMGPLIKESISRIEPMGIDLGVWDVYIRYVGLDRGTLAVGLASINFKTTGGSAHIRNSIQTNALYVPDGHTAVDHKQAINVSQDGTIDGVDVQDFNLEWSETWQFFTADATWQYIVNLGLLTRSVCDRPFRGFDEGEVRFLGIEGGIQNLLAQTTESEIVTITFNFAASPNIVDITIGDITGIEKKGFDYLWAEFMQKAGDGDERMSQTAIQVNIEQVYPTADLSQLGIGTGFPYPASINPTLPPGVFN